MRRRTFLKAVAGTAVLGATPLIAACTSQPAPPSKWYTLDQLPIHLVDNEMPPNPGLAAEAYFVDRVHVGSGGEMPIIIDPNGTQGSAELMIGQLSLGRLQMARASLR